MGGGLMQLVAYGAQDIYLTGNPQITFFKVVYRRHTNFSMESIQQTVNGSDQIGASSSTGTVTVSRNGDLVGRMYVRVNQSSSTGISGDMLISDVTLEIGGQQIDKHTREWLQVWAELSTSESHAAGYKYLTGGQLNTLVTSGATNQQSVMVPLQFYFCRNPGLALPLIALQYHEVKVKFTWGTRSEVGRNGGNATPTCEVWADYIYLDTEERRRFAQVSHEYLIEQLQYQEEAQAASQKIKLNFNHPVKELVWTNTAEEFVAHKTKLTLNGHDRFAEQTREYFQIRQPLDHHTAVPGFNVKETDRPQMLSQPELVLQSNAVHGSTAAASDSFVVVAHANSNNLLIRAADAVSVSVGDILQIHYPTTADAESETIIVKITAVPETFAVDTNDQAFSFLSCKTSDTAAGVAPTVSAVGNGTIYKLASVQDPQSRCSQLAREVNVYSFALKPEEHQPSGTCNFSRIDTAHLQFDSASGNKGAINVYAVNYNVLRVMSGMGGLAYSN